MKKISKIWKIVQRKGNGMIDKKKCAIGEFAGDWDKRARTRKDIDKRFGLSISVDANSTAFVKALAILTPAERAFIVERALQKLDEDICDKVGYIFNVLLEKRRKARANHKEKMRKRVIRQKARASKKPEKALKRRWKPRAPVSETEAAYGR